MSVVLSLQVLGLASGRKHTLAVPAVPEQLEQTLLSTLLAAGLAVAYSCLGKKICKTCRVHLSYGPPLAATREENVLSCSVTIGQLRKKVGDAGSICVEISYL